MKYKMYKPVLAWMSVLLLLLLAACGGTTGPDFSNQEGVEVNIFAGLGSTSSVETNDLDTQGVPSNPETGETGVATAELEVYSGDTQLFFDDGRIVDEGAGEAVVLTPDDSEVSLFLPEGRYRFALTALDEQGNILAQGETEQQVDEDSRVSIPMVSLIGSARFEVPESIKGNQVFDSFLRVSPPNRPDLEVALGDFSVTYDVQEPSVQLEGSSNLGVRVAAACDVVEVTATIDNDLSDTVNASASVPVNDPTCEGTGTDVGTDLVPPYVSINTPQADATLNKSFTLQGDVNDQQSGIDKVEVYEGTVKLGDATVDADNRSWSFDTSLEDGSYTLIAVAFDEAGNSSRAEVNVTVEEGSGNEVENCTNPVNIPDQGLREAILLYLGDDAGGDTITCENLARLVELRLDPLDSGSVENLEGLQYALNLEEFLTFDVAFSADELAPIRNLTQLKGLSLTLLEEEDDLSFLENLSQLESLRLESLAGERGDEDVVRPTLGLSRLQNLTNLTDLSLAFFTLNDLNPLVNNTGLGEGDKVNLVNSALEACPGTDDRQSIDTLSERGVEVSFDEPENCDGEGGNGGGDGGGGDNGDDNGGDDNGGGDNGDNDQACANPVNIPDAFVEEGVRDALGKQEGTLTCEDLASLTELSVSSSGDDEPLVSSLEGLQFATNLESLQVARAERIDLSPLGNLTKLNELVLSQTGISEGSDLTPLQNLSSLTSLSIKESLLSDTDGLQNLSSLTSLNLDDNNIGDLSGLQNLSSLTELVLSNNEILDVSPLRDLTNLTELDLSNNGRLNAEMDARQELSDISALQNLTNLTSLNLGTSGRIGDVLDGTISDISALQNLSKLTFLELGGNDVSDISALQNLTNLTELGLSNNELSNLDGLQNLTKLTQLRIDNNELENDLDGLQNLTNITRLEAYDSRIVDISALQNLTELTKLDLGNNNFPDVNDNKISDISALQNLTKLSELDLDESPVGDISVLQNLTELSALSFNGTEISDISPLVANEGLAQGDTISLLRAPLETCPGTDDRANIDTLIGRGAEVLFDRSDACQ